MIRAGDAGAGMISGRYCAGGERGSGAANAEVAGFTLVETVLVLVLVSVLAVVAAPRFASRSDFDARGFRDGAFSATRYAQKLAIASGCDVQVIFSPGGYGLHGKSGCIAGGFDQDIPHPVRAGAFSQAPPAGLAVSSATFYFDAIGRPRSSAGALLATATDVTLGSATLRVEAQTGFAHSP